jgi:hypothetical protein
MALGGDVKQGRTDSNIVDLYEELLYARAMKGIRPMLYVSSEQDLKRSVLKLLEEPRAARIWEEPRCLISRAGLQLARE